MEHESTNTHSCHGVSLGLSDSLFTTKSLIDNITNIDGIEQSQTVQNDDLAQLQKGHCFGISYQHERQLNGSPCSSTSWRADSMRSDNSSSSTVQQQSLEDSCNDEEEATSSDDGRMITNSRKASHLEADSITVRLKRYISINTKSRINSRNLITIDNNNSNNNNNESVMNNNIYQQQQQQQQPLPRTIKKLPIDESIEKFLNANRRQIRITTCAQIYNRWRLTKRLYHKAPRNGIQLEVDYIDTGITMPSDVSYKAPIVLALHGAPGSYTDYGLLIQHLNGQAIRVIAPNFPEYTATVETKTLFRHSADEKASYLRDFLQAINVNRIDLLVSHSSAVFPSLLILLNDSYYCDQNEINSKSMMNNNEMLEDAVCDNNAKQRATLISSSKSNQQQSELTRLDSSYHHIQIRSLALFNPAGHRLPQSMKPAWFKCGSVRIYQKKMGRTFFQIFGSGFLTIVGVPVRVNNMDHVMLSATVMRNSECHRVVEQLNYLSQLKLPTLLVFSENDKLIEKDIFYEMTQFMGLNKNHFDVFDHQGKVEQAHPNKDDWIRVMVFKAGGHYAYSNYANTVNKAVTELLCKVCSCSDSIIELQHKERNPTGSNESDDDKQPSTLLLTKPSHQQPDNRRKATVINSNRPMATNIQVKRHFKW